MFPSDRILETDSGGLRADPELNVFWSVVVLNPVSMVDAFLWKETAPEDVLHHKDVFKDIAVTCSGMGGQPHHQITSLVSGATSLPVSVRN